ncbi:L-seryl-tRNA(Sec) selenium transferase [Aquisphaera giovannonii]|uniref:L-seryl-tRNA(Sec) selenium transferase n=1 Tax=Aquisphaera giovannonii TaxID=406548 RepID=A0A5B9W5K3_9BACT|nr:L-seryl-tRNA(Sec) selenium transferase [Aquisphaera giovannonii]QEH35888.1 L-seryl-tRNA(Sec) selenium transferase [Aquisphaera giovannonii]
MGTANGGDADGPDSRRALRRLPAVHVVLGDERLAEAAGRLGREAVVGAVRAAIGEARDGLREGRDAGGDPRGLASRALAILGGTRPALRPVINATGILLHTGLGRSPLAEEAIAAVAAVARGYSNLELDLDDGERGRRTAGVARLLRGLTGAAAATVVNNNAGATMLALRAMARGPGGVRGPTPEGGPALAPEVIVSRGELVEIGGSFRLPEIFEAAGVRLREVGTTNRTRLDDYARAIGPATAAILRVHPSNYRIVGFTEKPALEDLASLARARGLPLIDDIGSGALGPGMPGGLADEPTAAEGVAAGADLVLFSGDKLLGGPQCGILVGSASAIRKVEAEPLMRALRVDKMTLAALEATLALIADPAHAASRLPLWRMIGADVGSIRRRAERLAAGLRDELGLDASVVESESFLGGGSAPVSPIPTAAVRVGPPFPAGSPSESSWARALRRGDPAVVPRVSRGAVLFDLRTVAEAEEAGLLDAIRRSCHDRWPDAGPGAGVDHGGPTP